MSAQTLLNQFYQELSKRVKEREPNAEVAWRVFPDDTVEVCIQSYLGNEYFHIGGVQNPPTHFIRVFK